MASIERTLALSVAWMVTKRRWKDWRLSVGWEDGSFGTQPSSKDCGCAVRSRGCDKLPPPWMPPVDERLEAGQGSGPACTQYRIPCP